MLGMPVPTFNTESQYELYPECIHISVRALHFYRSAIVQKSCLRPTVSLLGGCAAAKRLAHRRASPLRRDHTGLDLDFAPRPLALGLPVHGPGFPDSPNTCLAVSG